MLICLERVILPAVLITCLVQAQSPNYPPCLPSPEAAVALERIQRLRDSQLDGTEFASQQVRILRDALGRRPDDFHLQRRYLRTAGSRFLGTLHQELIAGYARRLAERPDDPVRRFLQAQSLVGHKSLEAVRLFEQLAEDHPTFAWPRLALAELHSYPVFQDHAKMQALSLAFLKLCPDSLEPYDLLYRTAGPALAEPALRLRRLLQGRTDPAAILVWPRLWNLEFKIRPASEHDTLRRQIRDDLAALRPVAENDYVLLNTLLQGAKLTGDAALLRETQSRQEALLPVRVKVSDRYREWQQKNPYPKPGSPLSDLQLFRRNKLAMLEDLLGDDPLNFWLLRERLSLLTQDDDTPPQLLATAGQRVLEAAVPLEEAWSTTPPALLVADDWARRGVNRSQLAGLVEKGLAHQVRIERNDLGSDLLDAKLMAGEMKEWALRNRISSFQIAAGVFIRLGQFDRARRALLVMAEVVKTGRDDLAAFSRPAA